MSAITWAINRVDNDQDNIDSLWNSPRPRTTNIWTKRPREQYHQYLLETVVDNKLNRCIRCVNTFFLKICLYTSAHNISESRDQYCLWYDFQTITHATRWRFRFPDNYHVWNIFRLFWRILLFLLRSARSNMAAINIHQVHISRTIKVEDRKRDS